MKRLLCIDGNSILNRQFYGVQYLSASNGFPTNALFGLVNVLSKQLESLNPDYAAVAFDLKAPTFRHKMYNEYKAGRRQMPEDLAKQFPVAKEICRAMGLSVLELEGYEADDILGTLSYMADVASAKGEMTEAYVLTGDRDSLQLIDDNVKVLLVTNTETTTFDKNAFFEKYGVQSSEYVDVKALMGDASDNIPGVFGIGEKKAFKFIQEKKSIEALYEDLDSMQLTAFVKEKLIAGKDSAFMSKTLATIIRDVPLKIELSDISYKGIDRKKARELFLTYDLMEALKRFGLDKDDDGQDGTCDEDTEKLEIEEADIDDIVNSECEYWALSIVENTAYISNGTDCYRTENIKEIYKLTEKKKIITYDCKALYKTLEKYGIRFRDCYFDVMLGAYVDDSSQGNFSFERLLKLYLDKAPGADIPDAVYIARMWKVIENKLNESCQLKLLMDIEMPLAGVLCDMEAVGCKIDVSGITEYGVVLDGIAFELEERIFLLAGETFNISSPKQLGNILFEKMKLPAIKKTKTGYSTDAEVLEKLTKYHPIIEDILEYRQVKKLKGTYVDGLLKAIDDEHRVHTTFKQTGTATGRLSSTDPNLQNIPIRTEMGRQFRKYFIPTDDNNVLIDADYSQIELRVMAHISQDENMIESFRSGYDIHSATACRMFGAQPGNVSVELRKKAKAVNFGILYGMGDFSLAEDLKVSRATAKEYIRSYFDSYPKVEEYLDSIVKIAKEQGYVTTMLGRRRYIPELKAQNKNIKNFGERVAMNSPVQGSSADIIKIAMINVDKRLRESGTGAKLLLQVHDELLLECPKDCAQKVLLMLTEEMENAVKLKVDLSVEAKCGQNWYECH